MQTHAHGARFHVPTTDDEQGVDLGFLGFADGRFDRTGAEVGFGADFVGAQFAVNFLRVVIERQHADLFGREPEREVAGVILDEEADEPFVRAAIELVVQIKLRAYLECLWTSRIQTVALAEFLKAGVVVGKTAN